MNLDKLHNSQFSLKEQSEVGKIERDALNDDEKKTYKNHLPTFLNWLKEQIDSANKQFSSDLKNLILHKPPHHKAEFIFILPDVLDRYYEQTKIAPEIIQSELKKALKITFSYTILREEKIIEVFPCKKFF